MSTIMRPMVRHSPRGSWALWCQRIQRPELVTEPSFSPRWAEGSRNTSVFTLCGSTPGRFQFSAVSVRWISPTTSQSRLSKARRVLWVLGMLMQGLWAYTNPPLIWPLYMRSARKM